jgi:hypothetical protein
MPKIVALVIIGFLLGCASTTRVLKIEIAPGTDFSTYKTFDFFEIQAIGDTIPARFNEALALMKAAIENEMVKAGYRRSSESPDLTINLGIAVKQAAQTKTTDFRPEGRMAFLGQRNYSGMGREVVVGYYRKGALDVHIVDVRRNALVWEGVVSNIIPENPGKISQAIQKDIQALFTHFSVK